MINPTSDIMDTHADALVCESQFLTFGLRRAVEGPIRTLRCVDDNALLRTMLEEPSPGSLLVVDGGGSYRTALLGDMLAALALSNGWRGLIIAGCIRDSRLINGLDIHVKALGVCPRKSSKQGSGERNVPIQIQGVTFFPGHYVYSDEDGIVMLPQPASSTST